ncbi:hypothetical protein C7401_13625 [Paraburkholderia unamae]|uniref:hypothetical protein n=1 Tax=Paraburkholderia unamae TaxID=219649 RepID=UPI000DC2D8A0|nr:hypothetical protein [Paraburkholderia unamae]RAR51665.1 hypothetical protein C7401_13625 [Paraburkholderia unamae]
MPGVYKGMPRAPKWSPEQDELLRKVWSDPAPLKTVLAQFPGRSCDSLVARGIRLGLPDRRLSIPAERTKQGVWPRIRAALEARRASIGDLAKAAGCSECTVKRFIKANRAQVHIGRYLRATGTSNVTALWVWGAGNDAKRPKPMTSQELKARYYRKLERERPEMIDQLRARARVRMATRAGRLVRRDPLVAALFGGAT